MKTAEEWALENGAYKEADDINIGGYCELHCDDFIKLVKQIQLDAWKQGMMDAANLANVRMGI